MPVDTRVVFRYIRHANRHARHHPIPYAGWTRRLWNRNHTVTGSIHTGYPTRTKRTIRSRNGRSRPNTTSCSERVTVGGESLTKSEMVPAGAGPPGPSPVRCGAVGTDPELLAPSGRPAPGGRFRVCATTAEPGSAPRPRPAAARGTGADPGRGR